MSRLGRLLPYFRPYRGVLAAGLLSIAGAVALGLVSPILIGLGVDSLRLEVSPSTLFRLGGVLVAVTFLQGICSFGQRRILVALSRDVEFDIRNDYFRHLQRLSQSFYQHSYTGDLMARGTNDLQAVRMLCGPAIMYSTSTVLTSIGALIFMTRIHPGLTLLALGTLPFVAIATTFFGSRIHRLFQAVQEQFSSLSTHVQENLAGVRVVRAYAREEAQERGFAGLNLEYVERNRHLIRWTAAFHPLLQGLVGLGFVAVLWYGGRLVTAETITVGQFVTFTLFLSKLVWPMIAIGWVINLVQRGSASLGRILEVIDAVPEVRDEAATGAVPSLRGDVEMKDLTFAYDAGSAPVLEDIDLTVTAGSTVALVGRTGAGKSTLLALLSRLRNPPRGTLEIDGTDILDIPLVDLRGAMAVVPQESFLFSTTVRGNIAMGRTEATSAEIEEAAAVAGLEEDLKLLPKGLETLVGERGVTLSGGQKQRLALARALIRKPRILLLDDCLSAVDTHTEERIQRNLRTVLPGRTVFLISHRVSAVQRADIILVLDRGRIVERGRHDDLVEADGVYADLARRQTLEEELEAV